jgi:BirA family biotin operon repressor/biotin-[acetyl-CoA-carboxylase] ligase
MNRDRILAALQTLQGGASDSVPADILIFDTLPSTNRTLWERLADGAPPGTTVIAARQTAGRGQWGRQWQSDPGGLYLSHAVAPDIPAEDRASLTLCAAWGIATALRDRGIPVRLKWPNDLLLTDRKLGGILTETKVKNGRIGPAAIGVGLNWSNPVPPTGINLRDFFADHPTSPGVNSIEMLAALVLWGIRRGLGTEGFMGEYLELLGGIGRRIVADGRPGMIVGVTAGGELRVQLEPEYPGAIASEICLAPGTIRLGYGGNAEARQ